MNDDDTLADAGTVMDSAEDLSSVDALADILDDPDDDLDTVEEDEADADEESDEVDAVEGDGDDTDPETDDAEDDETSEEDSDDDEVDSESEDGQEELKGGRIAPQSAKVKLKDGSLTTVEELIKGYERQSVWTPKMQALAEDRKALDTDRERVSQTNQQLTEKLTTVQQMLDAWKPQAPTVAYDQDPMAWGKYQADVQSWQQWEQQLQTQTNELTERQQAEQQQQLQQHLQAESEQLYGKIPALADSSKKQAFFNKASEVMSEYGYTPEEIKGVTDHRLVVVMRDLMKAKRLSQKAPEIKQQVKTKPKMIKGSKRVNPKAAKSQGASQRLDRLRETGSPRDAEAAFMDLDL